MSDTVRLREELSKQLPRSTVRTPYTGQVFAIRSCLDKEILPMLIGQVIHAMQRHWVDPTTVTLKLVQDVKHPDNEEAVAIEWTGLGYE